MATTISERVEKRRRALRQAGLRPVQIWVPDSGAPGFAEECARQCRLVAAADRAEPALARFLDAAAADLEGWTD